MAETGVDASAIRTAVDILYDRMLADPALAGMWAGTDMNRLRSHQRAFLLRALGGASLYSGHNMKDAHSGLGITSAQFTVMVGHLVASLRQVGVAQDVIDRTIQDIEKLRPLIVEA